MTTRVRFAVVTAVAFAAAFAVTTGAVWLLRDGGGGLAEPASAGQIRWTIEDAKQFDEFPLYG